MEGVGVIHLIHSYPGANDAFARHIPYYRNAGGDVIGVETNDQLCRFPPYCGVVQIGKNSYIDGPVLPQRLLDTIRYALEYHNDEHILISEYDTLFFSRIRVEAMETGIASHKAGGATWGSKASAFFHNPWLFARESAQKFLRAGEAAIAQGICPPRESGLPSTPECSPDVFFGYVCENACLPVQDDLWTEYSRNSLDLPGHLDEARDARRKGADVIHGVKTAAELEHILS